MSAIVLIPARLAATRLPNKPLAEIGGVPMIVRVLRQAEKAGVGPVAVAAGDAEIVAAVEAAGGRAVLTDPHLPSGSDRVQAALEMIDPKGKHRHVINMQGDVPFFDPRVLHAVARLLVDQPACDVATAALANDSAVDRTNPDSVKAILSLRADGRTARALYFTRSTPYGDGPFWHHFGIYGYRREALARFTAAPPSPLELREKLEQLRALELGLSIWATIIDQAPVEVNNPEDLAAARAYAEAHPE